MCSLAVARKSGGSAEAATSGRPSSIRAQAASAPAAPCAVAMPRENVGRNTANINKSKSDFIGDNVI